MRIHSLVAVLVLGSVVLAAPAPAHAGWVEFFFPMLKDTSNDPANTLRAPFAEPEEGGETSPDASVEGGEAGTAKDLQNPSNQTVPLHLSHRSDRDIAEWVTTAVSEVITFTEADSDVEMKEHKAHFDANGWKEFEQFLNETNIIKVVESDRYQLRSYVKGTPLLLNEGAVAKRYRWLYEVNADISYLERNVSDYKDVVPQNRTLKIMVQIGRSKDAENEIGLLLERWNGKVVQAEQ
jgi:hypothetical protein